MTRSASRRRGRRESKAESRVRQLAEELMRKHGLVDWTIEFGRGKQRLGSCDHAKQRILLSRLHVQMDSDSEVLNTILHEIAHALCDANEGHGKQWQAKTRQIGARPLRFAESWRLVPRHHQWMGTCPSCGNTKLSHRRSNLSCAGCSSVYDDRFRIQWTRNRGGRRG
jgi:predicted SprT family Zn-dependent metalloprotease